MEIRFHVRANRQSNRVVPRRRTLRRLRGTRADATAARALLLSLLCLAATPAGAVERSWAGTLQVDLGAFPSIAIRGVGVATLAVSNGIHLEELRLAGGLKGTVTVPITDPLATATVDHLEASASLGTGTLGAFSPIVPVPAPQLSANQLPIGGALRFCGLPVGCASGLVLPFSQANGAIAIGVGGVLTVGGFGPLRVSLQANPWTPFTATLPVLTASGGTVVISKTGFIHGPVSFSSSAGVSAAALQLVTPMRVTSNQGLNLAGFASLTLRFVPEPAAGWLLAAGAAALATVGAGRRVREITRGRASTRRRSR